jgi:hypothetical protein
MFAVMIQDIHTEMTVSIKEKKLSFGLAKDVRKIGTDPMSPIN